MPITYDAETNGVQGQQELVARISKFSKMHVSVPHNIDVKKYIKHDPLRIRNFRFLVSDIKIYANGYDSTNEGYVSVEFAKFFIPFLAVNQTYVISVIDAEGTRRYPQTFSEHENELTENVRNPFRIDRYISRRALLNEPSELIPDDTLTLHIDIDIVVEPKVECEDDFNPDWVRLGPDGRTKVLPLDSKLGKRLCEESKYFECLRNISLMEGDSGYKSFPMPPLGMGIFLDIWPMERIADPWEIKYFDTIRRILFCNTVKFPYIDDVFRLYKTADKYDIPLVLDFCRNCLELCLAPETAPDVLEIAEEFHDDRLRETAEKFQAADCRLPDENEFTVRSHATGMDYEWTFKRSIEYSECGIWIGTEVFYKGSRSTYDFYR